MVPAGLATAIRLAALARRVRADLIHTNGLKVHLLGGLAGRMIGTPVVWHLRDFLPDGIAGQLFRKAVRWLPTLVITNSDAVAASIRSGRDKGPCIIRQYNPVNLCRFHSGLSGGPIRRDLGLGDDVPLAGIVAHLTPWKGHELFLDIARQVTEAIPRAHFIVAGGPIYETDGHAGYPEALPRRASALGLADRLVFLGARDDIPEVLAALDVLVHCPTAPEPFGRAVAEAMAVGRPVVAARCGGIPEIVEDGITGLLAPPGDAKGFASAVVKLLQDSALRERFGRSARLRAESLFGCEAHADAVLKAYQSVLAGRMRRG
jgi:glycosyltransferase involved in cell wall biosynthesis